MKPVHFLTVVWGSAYTRNFLDLVLAAQLAPGNLPTYADVPGCVYKIYTTTEDAAVLRIDPRVAQADRHVRVHIVEFATTCAGLKFESSMEQLARGVREAAPEDAVVSFLPPDVVFSDDSFAALRRLHEAGKRLIMVATPRCRVATFPAAIGQKVSPDANGAIAIPARLLINIALEHLHPISKLLFADAIPHSSCPSHLYWWARTENPRAMLAHCFHPHPLLVDSVRKDNKVTDSVDGEYLHQVCPDPRTHHVVGDSDEIAGVELSRDSHAAGVEYPGIQTIDYIVTWARTNCNPTHLGFFRHSILLHDGPPPTRQAHKIARSTVNNIARQIAAYHSLFQPTRLQHLWRSWSGWFNEHSAELNRPRWCRVDGFIYPLKACWPSDLLIIEGRVDASTPTTLAAEWSGAILGEKTISSGQFRWVLPVRLALMPTLRIKTNPQSSGECMDLGAVRIWRTALHKLRHEYRPDRSDPPWIEWQGIQPGYEITSPCSVRVIPYRGVSSLTITVQSLDDKNQPGAQHTHTFALDAANPGAAIAINLPGRHRLLAVSCRETLFRRCWKEIVQILHFILSPIGTFIGRPQRHRT